MNAENEPPVAGAAAPREPVQEPMWFGRVEASRLPLVPLLPGQFYYFRNGVATVLPLRLRPGVNIEMLRAFTGFMSEE